MIKSLNKNYLVYFSIVCTILVGIIIRLYNLNFENLWFDEIVSFWISDPNITFLESYKRNNIAEGTPFLFNFILKINHQIFGYYPDVGRYLSCSFGILSIFSTAYLAKTIKNNNAYLLVLVLISLNVFLIKYSQELRVYSIVFFLCSLCLIFFFKLINERKNKNFFSKNSVFFILTQILAIFSHPFTLIIFFSLIVYILILFFRKRKIYQSLNISIGIISIFILLYLPFYIMNTEPYPGWVSHPNYSFYTNFYFSKFFGSRIMGLIYLFSMIYLILKFKDKFLKELNPITVLIFIIFLSYFLPIIFGYLHQPILAPRYIVFVLLPIILIISYLIYELRNNKIKYSLILLLVFSTILNQFTETNFKQFYSKRINHKPQYLLALQEINKSKYKSFFINMSFAEKNKDHFNDAINNYFYQMVIVEKLNIYPTKINKLKKSNYAWVICLTDLNASLCSNLNSNPKIKILKEKNFNSVNLKLIKII